VAGEWEGWPHARFVFRRFRKIALSDCSSFSAVRKEQLWTDFYEISYFSIFSKIEKILSFIKI
jgi:hypothetical protein